MKIGRGAGVNLAALAVSQLVGAAAGILVARRLGPEGVGALALVFGLFAVLHPLAAFTASASVIQHAKTPQASARVFGTSLALKLILAAALFVAAVALSGPIGALIGVRPALVAVAGSGFLAAAVYEVALNRLEAQGRLYARSLVLPVGPLVYLSLVFFFVEDTVAAAAATVAGSAAMSLAALPHLRGVRLALDPQIAAFMWRIGSRLVLGDLLFLGLMWFDTFSVNFLVGKAEAGIYQTAYNLAFLILLGATVLEITLVPLLAHARVRAGDPGVTAPAAAIAPQVVPSRGVGTGVGAPRTEATDPAFVAAYHTGSLLAVLLALAAAVVAIPFGPFVLSLYGPAFVAGYPALVVLLVMGAFGALFFPVKAVFAAIERPDLTLRITAAEFAVNVPLNLLLIPVFGIVGAALASVLAFGGGTVAGWIVVRRHTGAWPFPPVREWARTLRAGL